MTELDLLEYKQIATRLLRHNGFYATAKAVEESFEKQIRKRPKTRYGVTYYCPPDCGGREFDEYGDILVCPSCGKDIEENRYCKHCKECGQAIDWSEE